MAYQRYVALGDSFTEGVGDPDPTRPNGLRGWADRVAEALSAQNPDARYANLAIRGRKLPGIVAEQVEPAIALQPDLVTIHAGLNDVLRPRVDLDALAARYDDAITRLSATGAHVVMFATFDPGAHSFLAPLRGRMAIFNEFVREISDRRGASLVDMWRMRDIDLDEVFDVDRIHLNPLGHQLIAGRVLDTLAVPYDFAPVAPPVRPVLSRRQSAAARVQWTREHLVPWVHRRVTGRSSGDTISPRHPDLTAI